MPSIKRLRLEPIIAFATWQMLSLFLAGVSRAEDWPQWRGQNRDGAWREDGILESFPPGGLKVRWRVPVGPGWSSPVVAQGRVYVTDSELVEPVAKERVHCFDELSGKPLWTYSNETSYPDWAFIAGQEGRPSSTPLFEAGRVYIVGGNGHVLCLDALNGKLLWENRLDLQYEIEVLKCRPSPLIEENLLIVLTGAKPAACVIALDKNSGKEVWKALDETVSNSSPMVVAAGGTRQLIVWTGDSVTALQPSTGKTYWQERLKTSDNDAISSPVFHNNLLLISGLMFKLDPAQPLATVIWPSRRTASERILSNTSTPLIQGDFVFSARSSGELVCLEASTGQEVWSTDKVTELKRGASTHLTPVGDSLLLFTDEGNLIRAELTGKGYKEISRIHLLDPTSPFSGTKVAWSPAAFANRHIYVRNDEELVCASLAESP